MEAFEFRTKIKDGIIQIPKKYKQQMNATVKVIILSDYKDKQDDILDELLEHPVKINDFKPMARGQIYEWS